MVEEKQGKTGVDKAIEDAAEMTEEMRVKLERAKQIEGDVLSSPVQASIEMPKAASAGTMAVPRELLAAVRTGKKEKHQAAQRALEKSGEATRIASGGQVYGQPGQERRPPITRSTGRKRSARRS